MRYFKNEIGEIIDNILMALGENALPLQYEVENLGVPHKPNSLPKGKVAVYMFYCPKEKQFLKIGRVGFNSGARFSYQHYNVKYAKSNLASSLLNDEEMRRMYKFSENNVGDWIMNNCRRIDVLIEGENTNQFTGELIEACLHYKYKPRYEGKMRKKG